MAKFIKKPMVVEAEQFFEGKQPLPFADRCACCFDGKRWYVVTTHGQETTIVDGDWIIAESDGNGFYPCKPHIFEKTFDCIEM